MLDYDKGAARYDATRGGEERAIAAAAAVLELLPEGTRVVLDVACGTGIVSTRLRAPGRTVVGVDMSAGMLAHAVPRLDGLVARADATRLPAADASVDAVTFMWLLHLIEPEVVTAAIAEAARVLRPGGVMVTTVDKNSAQYETPSDVGAILKEARQRLAPPASDGAEVVAEVAARFGLEPAGTSGYVGLGQGRPPRWWAQQVRTEFKWAREADPAEIAVLCEQLAALPDQDVTRPDPVYKVAAFRKA